MKKILWLMLTALLATSLVFTGCKDDDDEEEGYTITYVLDGSSIEPRKATTGVVSSAVYTTTRGREGRFFDGWYYDQSFTKRVLWGDSITADTTFYGKWITETEMAAMTKDSQSFSGKTYSDFSKVDWYTRSSEKIEAIGNYLYTKATSFDAKGTYYTGSGVQQLGDVVYWSTDPGKAASIAMSSSNKTIGLQFMTSLNPDIKDKNQEVNIWNCVNFVMLKTTQKGTVTVKFRNSASSLNTSNAKLALVDGTTHKVIAIETVDNTKATSDESNTPLKTEAIDPSTLYLVFTRNGDEGGSVYITDITFAASSN